MRENLSINLNGGLVSVSDRSGLVTECRKVAPEGSELLPENPKIQGGKDKHGKPKLKPERLAGVHVLNLHPPPR
jgi:hypothetical protein